MKALTKDQQLVDLPEPETIGEGIDVRLRGGYLCAWLAVPGDADAAIYLGAEGDVSNTRMPEDRNQAVAILLDRMAWSARRGGVSRV